MLSLIEYQKAAFGELPERDNTPLFRFATENGGLARVDQCDFTGNYFVWFRQDWDHKNEIYPGYETRKEANEAAEAMVPRLLENEAEEKGAITPVMGIATAPFASQGNPQLAIEG